MSAGYFEVFGDCYYQRKGFSPNQDRSKYFNLIINWAPTRSLGDLFLAVSNLSKKDVWTCPFVAFFSLTMLTDANPKLESP